MAAGLYQSWFVLVGGLLICLAYLEQLGFSTLSCRHAVKSVLPQQQSGIGMGQLTGQGCVAMAEGSPC